MFKIIFSVLIPKKDSNMLSFSSLNCFFHISNYANYIHQFGCIVGPKYLLVSRRKDRKIISFREIKPVVMIIKSLNSLNLLPILDVKDINRYVMYEK